MATITKPKIDFPLVSIPVGLEQIAEGLKKLSRSELETIELLMNKKAIKTIQKSLRDLKQGKLKKL